MSPKRAGISSVLLERIDHAGRLVKARRETLLELLPPGDRATQKRYGSALATTFEDAAARHATAAPATEASTQVAETLRGFQEAVNHMWLLVIEAGLPEILTQRWRRQHRKTAGHLDYNELVAEAMFHMRGAIVRFNPDKAAFATFARAPIDAALNEYLQQTLTPTQVPRDEGRALRGSDMHASLDEIDEVKP